MTWSEIAAMAQGASLATFGESVTLRLSGNPDVVLQGVFTARYQVAGVGQDLGVSSSTPAVGLLTSDLPVTPVRNDEVDIRGTTYRVYEVQPDGEGWTRLLLHLLT